MGQRLRRLYMETDREYQVGRDTMVQGSSGVKDFYIKYVWLLALKTKDAVAVADQVVTELHCR